MKRIFILIGFLAAVGGIATPYTFRNDATGATFGFPIGTTYTAAHALLPLDVRSAKTVVLNNQMGTAEIVLNCSGTQAGPPPDTSNGVDTTVDVWPGQSGVIDNLQPGSLCYWKNLSGSVASTGIYIVTITGG